jgi:ribosome-interacting GTPase 1
MFICNKQNRHYFYGRSERTCQNVLFYYYSPDFVVISCNLKLNYPYLLEKIWEKLALVRVYTKKKGLMPDFEDPLVLT